MVSDEREVVVLALPADLVDPDVVEVVETVGVGGCQFFRVS
jgi:hypothetical protein